MSKMKRKWDKYVNTSISKEMVQQYIKQEIKSDNIEAIRDDGYSGRVIFI